MGYIDFCSKCQYAYTKDCKYGSKECNKERARIILELIEKNKEKQRQTIKFRFDLKQSEVKKNES